MLLTDNFREKEEVKFYALYVYAKNKSSMLEKHKTPTFLLEQALQYFSEIEEFDKAAVVKQYFDKNETRLIEFTKEEWELKQMLSGK